MPSSRWFPLALSCLLVAVCALLPAVASAASAMPVGSAPELPDGASFAGSVAPERELDLYVALEPRDPAGLERFAEEVATPGSPVYGQYLSVPQFAARFGADPVQVATVRAALTARGLDVGAAAANNLSLPVTATAAEAEAAFGTAIDRVETADGSLAFANRSAPRIAAAAAPYVQGVVGLDDLSVPHRADAPASEPADSDPLTAPSTGVGPLTGAPQPCLAANAARIEGGYNGYTADQLAAAYGLTGFYAAGNFGAGQTVALYEEEPFLPSDIATFQACYGTDAPIDAIDVNGGPGPYKGSDGEAAMDIEQIIQLAPAAHIRVYQGPNESLTGPEIFRHWVTENVAKVMSSSWLSCEKETESTEYKATNTLLKEAAAQGQSFFVAAGDFGSTDCETESTKDTTLNVGYPASDPFATGVGGTRMINPTAQTPTDYLWNDSPKWGAGGGGVSERFEMPSYQSTATPSLGVLNPLSSGKQCGATGGYCRQVPDVSANASQDTGYVIYTEGAWNVNGGTSAATPLWGAMTALINASATCGGRTVGFANPVLYAVAGDDYADNFRDVVEAKPGGKPTNNRDDATKPFPATVGYDMASGIGTPKGAALGASLCALANPVAPPTPPVPATPASTSAPTARIAAAAPAPASVAGARFANVRKGKPRLTFGLAARAGAKVTNLTVQVPPALDVAEDPEVLAQGIVVRSPGGTKLTFTATSTPGTIRIKLAAPQASVRLKVAFPALATTAKLAAHIREGRTKKLGLVVTTRETGGVGTRLPLTVGV